jgi:putative endonuclease
MQSSLPIVIGMLLRPWRIAMTIRDIDIYKNTILVIMKIHGYYVYILTNKSNNVLYVGVTNDIRVRTFDHKNKVFKGFSATYNCNKLVYYEEYQWIQDAIAREKQLKAGSRQKKIDLIVADNPSWNDLSEGWYD